MTDEPQGVTNIREAELVAQSLTSVDRGVRTMDEAIEHLGRLAGNAKYDELLKALPTLGLYASTVSERVAAHRELIVKSYLGDATAEPTDKPDDPPGWDGFGINPEIALTMLLIERWEKRAISDHVWQEGGEIQYRSGARISNRHLTTNYQHTRCILHTPEMCAPVDDTRFENLLIDTGRNWGGRWYRHRRENVRKNITWRDIYNEHADYGNLTGFNGGAYVNTIVYHDILTENIPGQALQLVTADQRGNGIEQPASDNIPGGPIVINGWKAVNVGTEGGMFTGGGESFPFSFARGKHDVDLSRIFLDNSMEGVDAGVMMCHGPINGEPYARRFYLDGGEAKVNEVNRDLFQLWNLHGGITIKNYSIPAFSSGNRGIDIIRKNADNGGAILIKDCEGDVPIKVNDVVVGTLSQGFVG